MTIRPPIVLGIPALIIALVFVCTAYAGEREERDRIANLSGSLFTARDFRALGELAGSYRKSLERTPAGMLKLRNFYSGIGGTVPNGDPNHPRWASAFERIEQWIDEYPDSPTPYVTKSRLLTDHGLAYRGTGWASKVNSEDWLKLKKLAGEARDLLIAHKDVVASDPESYSSMATADLALGTPEGEYRRSLDEGMSAFPNYDELYFRGREYYSPRWYGSEQAMEAFIVEAVERTKAARGHEMYARLYWGAGQRVRGGHYFQGPIADWTMMRDGIHDLVKHYPDQWNVNHLAFFACLKGDRELTEELIQMIEEPIVESAWSGRGNFDLCKHRIGQ